MATAPFCSILRHIRKPAGPRKTAATLLLMVVCLIAGEAGWAYSSESAKPARASEPPKAASNAPRNPLPEEEKVRTDRYGDPLPEGALARLGTIRFRQGFITYAVSFSPDGKTIACAAAGRGVCLWDTATGKELRQFGKGTHAYSIALCLWDVKMGKECRTLGKFANRRDRFLGAMEFSPDGRLLAFPGTADRVVHVWDAVAGVPRFQLKGLDGEVSCLTFSHDGKRIAAGASSVQGSPTIAVWDVKTGKSPVKFANLEPVDSLAFSPDGTILASASWEVNAPRLWDVTTGHALRSLVGAPPLYAVAFSPDGKWLAGAGADRDKKVHVWEVITGLEARSFRGHNEAIMSVAFAPNGRTLASGGGDSSILIWDFTGRMKDGRWQIVTWTPPQLEQRWKDLASKEGPPAAQAIWDLVADPERSVPLIRQRIKPVATADAQRVERLIDALDSDDFPTRTKATEELETLVEGAEPMLRKKLTDKPPLEMRRRIEQILVKLELGADVARLRALRAVQVLEYAGTTEANKCLETLANGLPEARLTREAKASLRRLAEKNE